MRVSCLSAPRVGQPTEPRSAVPLRSVFHLRPDPAASLHKRLKSFHGGWVPEGDTIHHAAHQLHASLAGQTLRSLEAPRLTRSLDHLRGKKVSRVEARGKHLLIHIDEQWVLHTHMKMSGKWHIFPRSLPPIIPSGMVLRLRTDHIDAVCLHAPVVELLTSARVQRHPQLAKLGSDLLADLPNYEAMLRQLRAAPTCPLGELLLDQTKLAGIGNVYKSELCFELRLNPFAPITDVSDENLNSLVRKAHRMMRANLGTSRRTTRYRTDGPRYWVYRRQGSPCIKCGAVIRMQRQGASARSTYFCPSCQRVSSSSPG